jgi:hypothetical protein
LIYLFIYLSIFLYDLIYIYIHRSDQTRPDRDAIVSAADRERERRGWECDE